MTGRRPAPIARRRCVSLVRRLERTVGVPSPFDLDVFLDRWSAHSGRAVALLPLTAAELPSGVCGLWLRLADQDVVGFPADAPRTHRDHIVLHEVGHMLAGHRGGFAGAQPSVLLPDLDPAMVRSVLGRSVYSDVQEQEAELIATLIMHRSLGTEPRTRPPGDAVVERLRHTLDD